MDDVRLPEFEVDSGEVARAHCRRSAQSGRVEFISGGDRRHNRLMVRAFWKLGCPSRRRTMRACAPALMRSPCSSRRPTVKQQPRARLSKTSGRRPQRRTRAGPSSCSMAPTYVQCPVIRFATSRRSAARWSGKDSPPGASRSCAAWPSSRMPCRAPREAAQLYREQRGRADRLRPARPGRQAGLDLTCGGHGQSAGERTHEQATANALVAPRRSPRASGQGRSAGRTLPPASNPARSVTPQIFDTPGPIA